MFKKAGFGSQSVFCFLPSFFVFSSHTTKFVLILYLSCNKYGLLTNVPTWNVRCGWLCVTYRCISLESTLSDHEVAAINQNETTEYRHVTSQRSITFVSDVCQLAITRVSSLQPNGGVLLPDVVLFFVFVWRNAVGRGDAVFLWLCLLTF